MRYFLFIFLTLFSASVFSADGEQTGYFGALWDFIDWVYEAFDGINQTILDYLSELTKIWILWQIQIKIHLIKVTWEIAQPIIASLNLNDVISNLFSGLSPDIQFFITELRIGEGLNLILSAYLTRMILRFIGF